MTLLKYSMGSQRAPEVVLYAERARWEGESEWILYNGWWRTANGQYGKFVVFRAEPTLNVAIRRTPVQIEALLTNVDERSFRQLREQIEFFKREGADEAQIRQLTVELYNKINVPLASLIFALLGAPLGIRPHRSSPASGFALSVAIIFVYWVMARYLVILGRAAIDPLLASSLPNLVGAALALWLIRKKNTLCRQSMYNKRNIGATTPSQRPEVRYERKSLLATGCFHRRRVDANLPVPRARRRSRRPARGVVLRLPQRGIRGTRRLSAASERTRKLLLRYRDPSPDRRNLCG